MELSSQDSLHRGQPNAQAKPWLLSPDPQAVVRVLELAPRSLGRPFHPPMPTPNEAEKQVCHSLLPSS